VGVGASTRTGLKLLEKETAEGPFGMVFRLVGQRKHRQQQMASLTPTAQMKAAAIETDEGEICVLVLNEIDCDTLFPVGEPTLN
jgi:hypothetical protein